MHGIFYCICDGYWHHAGIIIHWETCCPMCTLNHHLSQYLSFAVSSLISISRVQFLKTFFTWDTLLMMQLNSLYGDLPFDFIERKMSNGNFVLNTYHLKFYYLNFEGETQFILWKGEYGDGMDIKSVFRPLQILRECWHAWILINK